MQDVNRVGNGFAAGGTTSPRVYIVWHSVYPHFVPILLATDKYRASVGRLSEVTVELQSLTMTYANKATTTAERHLVGS